MISYLGLVVAKESEILPPRKSLRLQNIDADTGLKLPEKEPTSYSFAPVDEHPRLPLEDLKLEDIISESEKNAELPVKENFLSSITTSTSIKSESKPSFSGDVSSQLKALTLPV